MNTVFSCRLMSLLLAVLFCSVHAMGQDRVFVLCEGAQDFYSGEVLQAPVVGVIDLNAPDAGFAVLHTFEGQAFAADLCVAADGESLYVAGEDTVYRMDAWTGEILAAQALQGARQLVEYEGQLFVTRGDYDPLTWGSVAFDEYLVALDAQTLAWDAAWAADGIAGPGFSTEGACVQEGFLYVGINNAFAYGEEVGRIGRVELATGNYDEVDLGPEGLNPVHLLAAEDGSVITVNARQYDGTSLSRWSSSEVSTVPVAEVTAGCGAAAWHEDGVFFQVYGEGAFRKVDGTTLAPVEGWAGNGTSVYSMEVLASGRVLLGTTDFVSSGQVELWDLEEGMLWSMPVGVAPGKLGQSSTTVQSVSPMVQVGTATLEAACDVMGRPVDLGRPGVNGLLLHRWSDGSVTKEMRMAD